MTNLLFKERDRFIALLKSAVTSLCQNGMISNVIARVDGLLGVTLDSGDIFLVNIREEFNAEPVLLSVKAEQDKRRQNNHCSPQTATKKYQSVTKRKALESPLEAADFKPFPTDPKNYVSDSDSSDDVRIVLPKSNDKASVDMTDSTPLLARLRGSNCEMCVTNPWPSRRCSNQRHVAESSETESTGSVFQNMQHCQSENVFGSSQSCDCITFEVKREVVSDEENHCDVPASIKVEPELICEQNQQASQQFTVLHTVR